MYCLSKYLINSRNRWLYSDFSSPIIVHLKSSLAWNQIHFNLSSVQIEYRMYSLIALVEYFGIFARLIFYLTEHPFTDRSALYRIPLELVKNRKLHNEMLFFWVCFWFFQDSTNFKTCLLAAVNFCHWRFWLPVL